MPSVGAELARSFWRRDYRSRETYATTLATRGTDSSASIDRGPRPKASERSAITERATRNVTA